MTPLAVLIARAASPGARMLLGALDAAGVRIWAVGAANIILEHEGRRVVVLVGDASPPDGWAWVRVSERLCMERPQQAVVDVLAAVRERGISARVPEILAPVELNALAVPVSGEVQSSEASRSAKTTTLLPGRSLQ